MMERRFSSPGTGLDEARFLALMDELFLDQPLFWLSFSTRMGSGCVRYHTGYRLNSFERVSNCDLGLVTSIEIRNSANGGKIYT